MDRIEKKSLSFYVMLAFGFTWLCWITAIFLGYNDISFMRLLNWDFESRRQMILFFVFRIGVYGPLLASVIASYVYIKPDGMKDLWMRITKWNVDGKWYVYLFFLPIFINAVVLLIGVIIGIPITHFFSSNIPLIFIFVYFFYQILTSGLEEPGWRGFALERLQKSYTAEKASWILGLIWAVWHYPYVLFLYVGSGLATSVFSLVGFTLAIIGQTFIITWLYNNTRSVFITILFHAWLNTAAFFILGDITITNPEMGFIPALVTWAIAFILLKTFGGKTLTRSKSKSFSSESM